MRKRFQEVFYNILYRSKFKKFHITTRFSEMLTSRSEELQVKNLLRIIRKSKNEEDFENNIREYLKSTNINVYASALLVGNMTGKYDFSAFYYDSLEQLNIDAFSKENQELIMDLKSHFAEYIVNNNKYKNMFAQRVKIGSAIEKDLSLDIDEGSLIEDFEKVLKGEEVDDEYFKIEIIMGYIVKVIGTYSKEDIKNHFDFILYDMDSKKEISLEERRKKYFLHNKLSINQLKKLDELEVLKKRLSEMNLEESKQLLSRIKRIENALDENITELEDIYREYEVLYRQDLINHLYIPKEDITIIENYHDLRPQLIHKFIRNPEKFRQLEILKKKEKIISERNDGNSDSELTKEEQGRLRKMLEELDDNLNQYKVNYTTDGRGMLYTDSSGMERYLSNTTNQISASIFEGMEFIMFASAGIVGVGFNQETLIPEAIAISSNSYKTTNKGLLNLEYKESDEFMEMSSPFSELIKARGKSEVVMHRRGMDFDTKASYLFATIDSSNTEQTNDIMRKIEQIRKEEGLKVVIYDLDKIKKSLQQEKEESKLK